MPEDNNLNVRINTAALEGDLQRVKELFAETFAELEKYSSKSISPINITGLTELSSSIRSANDQLAKLNSLISGLNTAIVKQRTYTRDATTSTNELDGALKQYHKTQQDIIDLENKSEVQDTDAAKRKAELTVAIREKTRALREDAESKDPNVQKRIADEKAETDAALKVKNAKQQQAQAERDTAKSQRESAIASSNEQKALKQEAQEALKLSEAYSLLKQEVREKEQAYVRLHQSAGKNAPQTQTAFQDLENSRYQLNQIDKQLDSAAGGSAQRFGKALTGAFSQLRQLAYILPGIGIAGLFNIAFEAIGQAVSALGLFNDKTEEEIKLQKELADYFDKANRIIKERADIYDDLNKENTNYYERLKGFQESQGVVYEGQFENIDKVNQLHQQESQERIKDLTGIEDYNKALHEAYDEQGKLNGQVLIIGEQRAKIVAKIADVEDKLFKKRQETIPLHGFVQATIKKAGEISAFEDLKKTFDSELEEFDTKTKAIKGRAEDLNDAINKQVEANTASENERLKRAKYFEDEYRKIRLDAAKNEASDIKNRSDITLNAIRSSENDRINALKQKYGGEISELRKQQIELDKQKKEGTISLADYTTATADANEKRKELTRNLAKDELAITDEFNQRRLQAIKEISIQEAEEYLKKNEVIFQDEERSFNERLNGLGNYLQGRKAQIDAQYEYEKSLPSYKDPLEKKAQDTTYNAQISNLQADSVKKAREVTHSFVARAIKDLKEENQQLTVTTDVEKQYTDALLSLDNAYEKGEISLRKYTEARKHLAYYETLAKDTRSIGAAEQRIKNDKEAIDKNEELVESSSLRLTMAQRKNDENEINSAKAKRDEILNGRKVLNEELEAAQKALAEAELKYAEDKARELLQIQEKTRDNWKKIGDELIAFAQEVVDADYQRREESVEKNIALLDKQYDHEVNAIERSSLASKDKTALEIQLNAQKERSDEEAAKKVRRLKHDEAVADKAFAISKIIWDTERAVVGALAEVSTIGPAATALAISYGILGGIALARAAAAPVPALAQGTENWKGGIAKIGEAGTELVKEPNKPMYYVATETIKYLPKGTQVLPTYKIPVLQEKKIDDGWNQTKYLASIFKKGQKSTESKIVNNINIDLSFEVYKAKIIYGK